MEAASTLQPRWIMQCSESAPDRHHSRGLRAIFSALKKLLAFPRNPVTAENCTVTVGICVHNAIEDVRRCLASLHQHFDPRIHGVMIVDDGSDAPTHALLVDFVAQTPNRSLLTHAHALGYTRSANRILDKARSDVVVLLNSDTVVSKGWLDGLLECLFSHPKMGMVGPLSNAASWQSVPDRFDENGDWKVNALPEGHTVDDMAEFIRSASNRQFPRVPLLNGFCLAIKRQVIDRVGRFDEQAFPRGFGEENDYCLRALDQGFQLAIADHVYVFHAKSKSYTHEERRRLSALADRAFKAKHGVERVERLVKTMATLELPAQRREHQP